jgi:hypothetical protein
MDQYAPIAAHPAKTAQRMLPTAHPASAGISSKVPLVIPAFLLASSVPEPSLRALLVFTVTNSWELIACPALELTSMIQETLPANCAVHPAPPVFRATTPALHVSQHIRMTLGATLVYRHALRESLEITWIYRAKIVMTAVLTALRALSIPALLVIPESI